MQPVRFPDANDHELLRAAIRGLCVLVDGSLPARFERRAAFMNDGFSLDAA
jgi:hypothetical protein